MIDVQKLRSLFLAVDRANGTVCEFVGVVVPEDSPNRKELDDAVDALDKAIDELQQYIWSFPT